MMQQSSQPIRVLCVFSELDRGGAESMCMNLFRHVDKTRIRFDFVKHTAKKCEYEDEILSLGGRIFEAPRYRVSNHKAYCRWWENHFRKHPEHQIVHGHYYTISAIYFRIAHKYGRKTIAHSHSTSIGKRRIQNVAVYYWLSKINQYSDYRLACSTPAGKWLFGNQPFTVLNNAIDSELYAYNPHVRQMVREGLGLSKSCVIGTVGSMGYPKNPLGILEIIKRLRNIVPNIKFVWVGDGSMRNEIEALIHQFELDDCCILLGIRSDVNRILQAMDLFILPSIYEGLPVVAIEAQAAGLPCLLSDVISREVDITGLCQFLSIQDYDCWVDAIIEKTSLSMRKNTQQQIIAAGYDIGATAAWMEQFYTSI